MYSAHKTHMTESEGDREASGLTQDGQTDAGAGTGGASEDGSVTD